MKQLLLAAAVTLSLATIPAIATAGSTVFTYGPSVTASSPDDSHSWTALCNNPVVIDNDTGGSLTVLIKVDTATPPSTGSVVVGGEPAKVTCGKDVDLVKPGNFFVCKTKKDITIADAWVPGQGTDYGAKGYFTVKHGL